MNGANLVKVEDKIQFAHVIEERILKVSKSLVSHPK